jgi:hypothetical protein
VFFFTKFSPFRQVFLQISSQESTTTLLLMVVLLLASLLLLVSLLLSMSGVSVVSAAANPSVVNILQQLRVPAAVAGVPAECC